MFIPHASIICHTSQNLSMKVGEATSVKVRAERMASNRVRVIQMPRRRGAPLNASIGLVAQNSRLWGPTIVPISIHKPIQRRNSPYKMGFSPWGRFWLVWGRIVVLMKEEKNNPSNKLRFEGLDNDDVQKVSYAWYCVGLLLSVRKCHCGE